MMSVAISGLVFMDHESGLVKTGRNCGKELMLLTAFHVLPRVLNLKLVSCRLHYIESAEHQLILPIV